MARVQAATRGPEVGSPSVLPQGTSQCLGLEEARLEKGRQKLETLVHVTKAVYGRDVVEVERERIALEAECVEAIAAKE
ncbi:hypothetical protein E2562_015010 [Oryza meyeriana var. granulata]|uniref:Uncharacterized protein n=1 Tax=Oryza meyeriana var. granulata TaxID=110450 RepID=A0A6G1EJD4_9ORYZ|nr:hypothetical protein E2562_015010 [Oryza meyeriana var. granulata]